jgi:hypothetical protein
MYIPWAYLRDAVEHPGIRTVPCNPFRSGSVVDQWALPSDHIAVHGDFDTNLYPAFGAELTRRISFLKPDGDSPAVVPADAQWVIVDRSWNAVWNSPEFKDTGQAFRYLFHGKITDEDLRVFRQLKQDPEFVLVYRNARINQAVFLRRRVAEERGLLVGTPSNAAPPDAPRSAGQADR